MDNCYFFFSFPIALDITSDPILNKSGKSGDPGHFSDLRGKTFSFLSLSICLSTTNFILLRYVPSTLPLLNFSQKWTLPNPFFASIEMIIVILHFDNVIYHLDWCANIEPSIFILGINPT